MHILFAALTPLLRRGRNPRSQPRFVSLTGSEAGPARYPAGRRFPGTAGECPGKRLAFLQAATGSVSALTWAHRFTRWMGSRHAALASISSSKPFAPTIRLKNILVNRRPGCQMRVCRRQLPAFSVLLTPWPPSVIRGNLR